jgi:hypothetical protein
MLAEQLYVALFTGPSMQPEMRCTTGPVGPADPVEDDSTEALFTP